MAVKKLEKGKNPLVKKQDGEKKLRPSGKNFKALYEEKLPDLVSTNIELQSLALNRVREMIGSATAVQAATIYGILTDKTIALTGRKEQNNENNTINMYFGEKSSPEEMEALMGKVMGRMNAQKKEAKKEVVDVEYTVEGDENLFN